MKLSDVCHRLLTHALDDLEGDGDSTELTELKMAMLKVKEDYVHPNIEKINLSLERLEKVVLDNVEVVHEENNLDKLLPEGGQGGHY